MMTNITPAEAAKIMKSAPDIQVLDVRTEREFFYRRLPKAINIPVQELSRRLHELDKRQEIIVLCEHGIRSVNASFLLEHAGFDDVYNMLGGMSRWTQETLNCTSNGGSRGTFLSSRDKV